MMIADRGGDVTLKDGGAIERAMGTLAKDRRLRQSAIMSMMGDIIDIKPSMSQHRHDPLRVCGRTGKQADLDVRQTVGGQRG